MLFNLLIFSCLVSLPLSSSGRNQHMKKHSGFHQPKKENIDLDKYDHHLKLKDWKREDTNKLDHHRDIESHHKSYNTNKFSERHGENNDHRLRNAQNKPHHRNAHSNRKILNLNQSDNQQNDQSRSKKTVYKPSHQKSVEKGVEKSSFDVKVHHKKLDKNDNHGEQNHHKTTSKGKSSQHKNHHKSINTNSNKNIEEKVHQEAKLVFNSKKDQIRDDVQEQKNDNFKKVSLKKRRSVGVWNPIDSKFQGKPIEYPVTTDYPVMNEYYFGLNSNEMGGRIRSTVGDRRVKSSSKEIGRNRVHSMGFYRPYDELFSRPVAWENFFKEIESNIDRVMKLQLSHLKGIKSSFPKEKLNHGDQYNKYFSYLGSTRPKNIFNEGTAKQIHFKENNDFRNQGVPEFPKAFVESSFSKYEKKVEERLEENMDFERKKDGKYLQDNRRRSTSNQNGAGIDLSGNCKKHHHHSSRYLGHRPNNYYETGFPSLGHFRPTHHSHHSYQFGSAHSINQHYFSYCNHNHDNPHTLGVSTDKEDKIVITTPSHDDNQGTETHGTVTSFNPSKELFQPVNNFTTTLLPPHQYAVHETQDESNPAPSYQLPLNNSHHVHINQEIEKPTGNASSGPIYFPREEIDDLKQESTNNNDEGKQNNNIKNSSDLCKNGESVQIPLLNINLPCGDVSVSSGHPDDFYKREFVTSMTNVFHDYVEKEKQEEPLDIDPRIARKRREVKRNFGKNIEKPEENKIYHNGRGGAENVSVFGEIVQVPKGTKNDPLEYFDLSMLSEYFLEAVDSLDEPSLVQVLKDLKDDYLSKSPSDEKTVDQVYKKLVSSLLEYKRSNGESDRRRRESPRKARAEAAAMLELLSATDGGRMESEQRDEPYSEHEIDYNQLDVGPESSENPSFLELVSLADKHKSKA